MSINKNNFSNDKRLIFTLDVGGTNLKFCAYKAGEIVGAKKVLAFKENEIKNLDLALEVICNGFDFLHDQFNEKPSAISFSFPGPCDYQNGVTLNEGNLPAFSGGVALTGFLENKYKVPCYMNNDGDLYAYGEYFFGALLGSRYKSLLGLTLGTGVGGGFCLNGKLLEGENSNALEVWTKRNGVDTDTYVEEGVSKRAITNYYGDKALSPDEIYEIALGQKDGDRELAIKSFEKFGEVLGELIADLVTVFDAPIALGGGISKGYKLFSPKMIETINGTITDKSGNIKSRIVQECYFLDIDESRDQLPWQEVDDRYEVTTIPNTDIQVKYIAGKRIPVFIGKLETSEAIQLGAYSFALNKLDLNSEK